jgi:hypothetical protein
MTEAYEGEGVLANSGQFNEMDSIQARERIAKYLEEKVKPQVRELLTQYGP